MKTNIFLVAFVCVFLSSCASAPREKEWVRGSPTGWAIDGVKQEGVQTFTFEGLTYNRVWDACEQTLINLSYLFAFVDKSAGQIRVRGTAKSEFSKEGGTALTPTETRDVLVFITKTDGGVAVRAGLVVVDYGKPRQKDVAAGKNEVDRIFKNLKKKLK